MNARIIFFLRIVLLNVFLLSYAPSVFSDENNQNRPVKRVAVCYWGLTRSTKKVYQSHFDHLFNVLNANSFEFDVYMHTWMMKGKQRVWNRAIDKPIDYEEYKLLNPDFYRIDNQDEFTDNLAFDQYFYPGVDNGGGFWSEDMSEKLILNVVCALESLKRVTEMMELSGIQYDYIIYVRPDARLKNDFPANGIFKLKDKDIILPDCDHHGGYNDRFAALNRQTAPIYGKRIDGLAEFRRIKGYIHAEHYLHYTCSLYSLNVIQVHFPFDLVRP